MKEKIRGEKKRKQNKTVKRGERERYADLNIMKLEIEDDRR